MIISSQKQNRSNKKSIKMSKSSSAKSGTDFSIAAIMGRNAMQDDTDSVSSKIYFKYNKNIF